MQVNAPKNLPKKKGRWLKISLSYLKVEPGNEYCNPGIEICIFFSLKRDNACMPMSGTKTSHLNVQPTQHKKKLHTDSSDSKQDGKYVIHDNIPTGRAFRDFTGTTICLMQIINFMTSWHNLTSTVIYWWRQKHICSYKTVKLDKLKTLPALNKCGSWFCLVKKQTGFVLCQ